jgi:hypothetical protein
LVAQYAGGGPASADASEPLDDPFDDPLDEALDEAPDDPLDELVPELPDPDPDPLDELPEPSDDAGDDPPPHPTAIVVVHPMAAKLTTAAQAALPIMMPGLPSNPRAPADITSKAPRWDRRDPSRAVRPGSRRSHSGGESLRSEAARDLLKERVLDRRGTMDHFPMRRERAASLAVLLTLAVAGCFGTIGDAGTGNGGGGGGGAGPPGGSTCAGTPDVGPSQILRLSKTQYVNVLTDLFGSAVVSQLGSSISQIPDDDTVTNPAVLTTVSDDHLTGYMAVAMGVAQAVTSSPTTASAVFGSCSVAAQPNPNCVDTYLTTTAPLILRRPLTTAEVAAGEAMVAAGTDGYLNRLGALLAYHLQNPWFTNRIELGTGPADTAPTYTLTPFEVAARIAFETTDSMPDAALFGAAAADELSMPAQLEAQVRRLLATTRGKAKIRSVLYNYVGNPSPSDLTVLPPALLSGLSDPAGLSSAMFTELDAFIDYIVWEKNGSLVDLLTSQASFASDPDLANIYGHAPADANRAPGSPTAVFSGRRAGILMRLPLLASPGPRNKLPHRGVTILRNVLCAPIPDPDAKTMAMIAALSPSPAQLEGMTTRKYLETVTANGICPSCHQAINPVGFAFENLGPAGRLRTVEAIFTTDDQSGTFVTNLPIDTTSQITIGTTPVPIADALDLVTQIASSASGTDCFVRRAYQFVQQRTEANNDECTIDEMKGQLTKISPSILDALVAAVANDATTLHRKAQ